MPFVADALPPRAIHDTSTPPDGLPTAAHPQDWSYPPPDDGAPPPSSGRPPLSTARAGPGRGQLIAAACCVIAVIAAAVVTFTVLRPAPKPTPPQAAPADSGTVTTNAHAPTTPRVTPPATLDPATALQQEVAADSATAESLVGAWVPQVSSKREGLVVDGVTYDDAQIWADFQRSRESHVDAILLRSGDFSSFRQPGYWVTVIAESFPTADAANIWCGQQGYNVDDCFAKRLSHTDGPTGNTVPRA